MDLLFGNSASAVQSIDFSGLLSANNITYIDVSASPKLFSKGEYDFEGTVKFRKGEDAFQKTFKGDNLADVFMKVYNFCQTL